MMLRAVPGSLPCIRMLSLALALLVIADLLLFENLYSWPSKQQPKFGVDLENLIRTETAEAPNKQQREKKSHIILFVGILNKISLHSRRSAIRSTWMSQCYRNEVVCKFFTDPIEILSGANLTRFKDELATNGDMISMPYTGIGSTFVSSAFLFSLLLYNLQSTTINAKFTGKNRHRNIGMHSNPMEVTDKIELKLLSCKQAYLLSMAAARTAQWYGNENQA